MREKAEAKPDSTFGVGSSIPWDVVRVDVLPGYRLHVRFADGVEGEVDMSRLVSGRGAGVFRALRDPAVFAEVRIEGGAVTWPGELDLAPDAMHDEIRIAGRWVVE